MVLDILDTLTHPTRFDDFVVLSTDADFTPVFMRLREHDRTSAMLVSGPTAAALQSVCDFAIPDIMFIEEALGLSPSQAGNDQVRTPVPQPRATVAALADRVDKIGDATPPCGEPLSVACQRQSSKYPAVSMLDRGPRPAGCGRAAPAYVMVLVTKPHSAMSRTVTPSTPAQPARSCCGGCHPRPVAPSSSPSA